jgi:short-subunit dehydrogenase
LDCSTFDEMDFSPCKKQAPGYNLGIMKQSFHKQYGPWAVVAGASEGLGRAFACELAGRGLNLVLIARRREILQELAAELQRTAPVKVRIVVADLGQPELPGALEQKVKDIEVGLLVYNAAFSAIGRFLDRSLQEHKQLISVNCAAPAVLCRYFGERMGRLGHGGIVIMSSLTGIVGTACLAHYAASKAYLRILAEGLWSELKEIGVDVISCCAGAIDTPNYRRSLKGAKSVSWVPLIKAEKVVDKTLNALGRKITIIPGVANKLNYFFTGRLLSRKSAVGFISRVTKRLYEDDANRSVHP